MKSKSDRKKIIVGIIGGTGKIGQFFKRFFELNECKVLISSRGNRLSPKRCAELSDVVLISVPISVTLKVIKEVAPYIHKDSLLIDTTSIKKEPVDAMVRYSKSEVIGMHPVFSPDIKSLKNKTIVLCPARTKKWLKWLVRLFKKNKVEIKVTTPDKHDEMMSIIQGLNHFDTLNMIYTMNNLGADIKELLDYASPGFKLKMRIMKTILDNDPELYADMEMMNVKNDKVLKCYLESTKKFYGIVKDKNKKEFFRYFSECSEFFK